MGLLIHCELCKKWDFTLQLNAVCTNQNPSWKRQHKIRRDLGIQKDHLISVRWPYLEIVTKIKEENQLRVLRAETFQRSVWHPCWTVNGQCSMADLRPKDPWLRLCHLQMGELHHWHLCHICIALAVQFKLSSGIRAWT